MGGARAAAIQARLKHAAPLARLGHRALDLLEGDGLHRVALGAAREDHPQLGRRRRHIVEAGVTQPGWSRPAGGIGDFGRASGPPCSLPLDPGAV